MHIENLILKALRVTDMTIEEVSKKLKIHRITATKYLSVLEAKRKIKHRDIGRAKLFSLVKQ